VAIESVVIGTVEILVLFGSLGLQDLDFNFVIGQPSPLAPELTRGIG
jgi:hypothetical protein